MLKRSPQRPSDRRQRVKGRLLGSAAAAASPTSTRRWWARACLDEGVPVHSYLYWSLLDNFEWSSGYAKHVGLAAVDLNTFKRTPKPSARYLGRRAKLGLI